jgi:hypothetical protein
MNLLAIPSEPFALIFDFSALLGVAWGTTLIEIAVYMIVLGEHTANQGHVKFNCFSVSLISFFPIHAFDITSFGLASLS